MNVLCRSVIIAVSATLSVLMLIYLIDRNQDSVPEVIDDNPAAENHLTAGKSTDNETAQSGNKESIFMLIKNNGSKLAQIQNSGGEIIADYGSYIFVRANLESCGELQPLKTCKRRLVVNGISVPNDELPADMFIGEGETEYYIVQFIGPVKEEWLDELRVMNVRFKNYYHDFAFLARIPFHRLDKIRRIPAVLRVEPYHPAFRLARWVRPFDGLRPLNVKVTDPEHLADAVSSAEALGAVVFGVGADDFQIEAPYETARALARVEGVEWIDAARKIGPANAESAWDVQSGFKSLTNIWEKGIRGEGQLAGMADSGIDYDHEAFRDDSEIVTLSSAASANASNYNHRKIVNYRASSWGDFIDQNGHGTHCACTLAGDNTGTGNSSGSPNGVGLAPKAKIVFTDVRGADWPNPTYSQIPEYFNAAISENASVHSDSWGEISPPPGEYTGTSRAFDEIAYANRKMLIFNSQGNFGTCDAPATAKNIVSVGGTGAANDGRLKPDVDCDLTTTSAAGDADPYSYNSGYYTRSGTSMGTPVAAGCCLLVRQYFTEGWYPSGERTPADSFEPTAALMKAVLLAGGRQVFTGNDGSETGVFPNDRQGWGWLCLDKSLYFKGETERLFVVDDGTSLHTGQFVEYGFDVAGDARELRVILTWTDYPAAAGANAALVNDLDLVVTTPDGIEFPGNRFEGFHAPHSVECSSRCDVDNVEGVIIPDEAHGLVAGRYTITVEAANVPYGPQDFAVAVVGPLDVIGGPVDVVPPSLWGSVPSDGQENVSLTTAIELSFSEPIEPSAFGKSFSISPQVNGSLVFTNSTLVTFTPETFLDYAAVYTVTLNESLTDRADNPIMNHPKEVVFTTRLDSRPVLSVTTPPDYSAGDVKVVFRLLDLDADEVDVSVGYSLDSGNSWNAAAISYASAGTVNGSAIKGVPGSAIVTEYYFHWDSRADGVGMEESARVNLRLSPFDGETGGPSTTARFKVNNTPGGLVDSRGGSCAMESSGGYPPGNALMFLVFFVLLFVSRQRNIWKRTN